MDQHDTRPSNVTTVWQEVDPERESREEPLRCGGDVLEGPAVTDVAQLLLPGVFVSAATVLVVAADRRVVVAGHAGDLGVLNERDRLVGPGGIANQIAEM